MADIQNRLLSKVENLKDVLRVVVSILAFLFQYLFVFALWIAIRLSAFVPRASIDEINGIREAMELTLYAIRTHA